MSFSFPPSLAARRSGVLVLIGLLLAGCGHMPVSTMIKLRNFDMLSVDPGELRAAVRLPATLEPQAGGVTLKVSFWPKGGEANKQTVQVVLSEDSRSLGDAALQSYRQAGTRLFAYRVSPEDADRLRAAQADFRRRKAEGKRRYHGSLSIDARACRRGDLAKGPVYLSTFLNPGRGYGFLPMTVDVDMRRFAKNAAALLAQLPECGKTAVRASAP
ncbi:MAG: hypothetical protein KDJ29_12385 [Hyphomicrobiales bacterium]|nr:hypothetical protein [Hyphomicrobiales bacterium]